MATSRIEVNFHNNLPDWDIYPQEEEWRHMAEQVLQEHVRAAEVDIYFEDLLGMQRINSRFRNQDNPTNTISLIYQEASSKNAIPLVGECFFCPQVIEQEISENALDRHNYYRLLAIHSFLHLLGYDHVEDSQYQIMQQQENYHLARINSHSFT